MALVYGLLGAVLVLLAALGVRMARATLVDDLVDEGAAEPGSGSGSFFTRVVDLLGAAAQRLLLGLYGRSRVSWLSGQLRAAGQAEVLTPTVFIQREAGFVTLGAGLLLVFTLNSMVLPGLLLAVVFAGWMHVWLLLTVRARAQQIERDLPDFLDVFAVTVAAGLPFRAAMDRVTRHHSGPLAEELRSTLREMQLGVTRRQALERLRKRNRSRHVSVFVTALLQAEELGTPLAEALQDISAEVRRERAQQVRQAATKAQPKVSLVVTMIIIPGVIVLVLGGLVVMNMDSLREVFSGG